MSGAEIEPLRQLCVYAWKRGDLYLYIGVSSTVLARILTHNIINRATPMLPDDQIEFWQFTERSKAEAFEKSMIIHHRPQFNLTHLTNQPDDAVCTERACLTCGDMFRPKRPWQKFCTKHRRG